MLRGCPGVSILDDLLRLDDLLMLDDLSGFGQHLGRTRDGPIFVVSYMNWTTTQGRTILVSHPPLTSTMDFTNLKLPKKKKKKKRRVKFLDNIGIVRE